MQFKASTVAHLPCWSWQLTTFAVHVSTPDPDRLSNSNRIRFHGHCNYPSLPTSARLKSRILQCESSYHFFTDMCSFTIYFITVQKNVLEVDVAGSTSHTYFWSPEYMFSFFAKHRRRHSHLAPVLPDSVKAMNLLSSAVLEEQEEDEKQSRCAISLAHRE